MEHRHFTLVVVGEHPESLLSKYDSNNKQTPYVVYEYAKAGSYRQMQIDTYKNFLMMENLSESTRIMAEENLHDYENMDDIDFYLELTDGYTMDEETGNAMSTKNPDGKYNTCRLGKNLSMPLINKFGEETFSEIKGKVDWGKIHMAGQQVYADAWDMVMEGKKPSNEYEENIFENMKYRTAYFQTFGTRENYVASSTAFWGYAFLSEATGWVELDANDSQFEWCKNFFDRFIKPLSDTDRISIYECTRE